MKLIPIHLAILFLCSVLTSCLSPREKTIKDKDVTIEYSVEDISDTKFKFGTRSVGLDKKRGFHIIMTIDDRNSIIVYQHLNMKSKPKGEHLSEVASGFDAVVSPDKNHVAVSFTDTTRETYIYHLLPAGEPFTLEKYNQAVQQTDLNEIDWSSIPEPDKIAIEFIEEGIEKSDNYPILNKELWNAVSMNMPGSVFDELVISCWPNVFEAQDAIDTIMAKSTDYNAPFFKLLESRVKEVFENSTSNTNRINAIIVGYELGDENLHATLFEHTIAIWPESPTLQQFVRKYYHELPEEIQTRIIDKSIQYYKQTETYAYKNANKQFLNDFADSIIIESLKK